MSDLLYVADLAKKIGKSEAALRAMIYRESPDIPAPMKIGRKLCWKAATIDKWIADKERRARRANHG